MIETRRRIIALLPTLNEREQGKVLAYMEELLESRPCMPARVEDASDSLMDE